MHGNARLGLQCRDDLRHHGGIEPHGRGGRNAKLQEISTIDAVLAENVVG